VSVPRGVGEINLAVCSAAIIPLSGPAAKGGAPHGYRGRSLLLIIFVYVIDRHLPGTTSLEGFQVLDEAIPTVEVHYLHPPSYLDGNVVVNDYNLEGTAKSFVCVEFVHVVDESFVDSVGERFVFLI
jgi:hypothetical protein